MKEYIICLLICLSSYSSIACFNGKQHFENYPRYSKPLIENSENFQLNNQTISNLKDLCKVWGVLKYYHPINIKGSIDWDNELLKFLQLNSIHQKDFHIALSQWITNLKLDQDFSDREDSTLLQNELFQWINPKKLGKKLYNQLSRIVSSNQQFPTHYYVDLIRTSNPQFPNEKEYPDIKPWEKYNYRLLTLFRIWNVIEYFYPYKPLIQNGWNSVLNKHISPFIKACTQDEYYKALLCFTAELCDSHVSIISPSINPYKVIGLERGKRIPILLEYIENKYVITKLLTDHSYLKEGDVVTHIGNKSLDSLTTVIKPYLSSSNNEAFHASLCMRFIGTESDTVPITISNHRKQKTTKLPSIENKIFMNTLLQGDAIKTIGDSIGYIDISKLNLNSIPSVMTKMSNKKGLIIDMREYPKEFVLYIMGNYLINENKPFVKLITTQYKNIGIFNKEKNNHIGITGFPYYKGKIILIVNSGTMSQGEFTAMAWSLAPQAKTIGNTTAGTDGNVSELPLPGGNKMTFTGLGIYYPDGKQTQRIGIKIDEVIHPSINGIRQGRDELLERALEIINKR